MPEPSPTVAVERRPIVRAHRLTKTFRLFDTPADRWRAWLGLTRPALLTAVREVSFELPAGGALGIVGENGAGKSTLLRLLAGITRPTAGSCRVAGRVGSILELGASFHPELTGRQNIRLSAALVGLDPARIRALTREIIDFSGLGDFIDQPVKRYSSGMMVRLGFAVATQSEPDVLIVDEALSVGDGRFQKKCLDRIQAFRSGGGTLVFCSHALYYVTSVCDQALWLREGRVAAHGAAVEVASQYEAYLQRRPDEDGEAVGAAAGDPETQARIVDVRLLGGTEAEDGTPAYELGQRWGLQVRCRAAGPDVRVHVGVGINTGAEREVFICATHRDGLQPLTGAREHVARLWVPELPLRSGEFILYVFLLDEEGLHVYDRRRLPRAFRVSHPVYSPALIDPPRRWEWPAAAQE